MFPPLLLLEVGMLLGMGVFVFVVVTSHICFEGGQTMMVCLESYAVLRMSYIVLRVVEIIRCLVNAHNGCHAVLCRTFFNRGECGSGSVMKSPSQFMTVEAVVAGMIGMVLY